MAGWDTNWAATEAKEKRACNVLRQLRNALLERVLVMTSPLYNYLPPMLIGSWDDEVTYLASDAVTKDFPNEGEWNAGTAYTEYDMVTLEDDEGEWARGTTYNAYQRVTVSEDGALEYNPALTYVIGEYVTVTSGSLSSMYICIQGGINKAPASNPLYWTEVDSIATSYYISKGASSGKPPAANTSN